jgi:hypothetical protein
VRSFETQVYLAPLMSRSSVSFELNWNLGLTEMSA